MENKATLNLNYKRGILLSIFSIVSLIAIFYLYSRNTLPGNDIFINNSLYTFAQTVLMMFGICIFFILIGIKRALFTKEYFSYDPSKIIYYIQSIFKPRKYKTLFIIITTAYFIFFGFLSSVLIFFNNDGTVFSLFPNHTHDNMNMKNMNMKNMNMTSKINYPSYNLIICCNSIGYVPMLILSINSNFSFLLIPINFLLGLIISILVGLNITLNVYILKQIRSIKLSKRNLIGFVGLSSGLFVGCPTCAGSFFYSIAGFSSLITFSFLSAYQIIFIIITIPLLLINLVIMAKVLQGKFSDSCKIK
ncbi:MAG TPA: hypothetical protein VIY08_11230 [Candidatus Nitrosocosmicus sp.]